MFFWDLILSVPFNGILVRYRAASHPKASVEDGSVPPAPTFISMSKRVWRLQGVEGLSRGLSEPLGYCPFVPDCFTSAHNHGYHVLRLFLALRTAETLSLAVATSEYKSIFEFRCYLNIILYDIYRDCIPVSDQLFLQSQKYPT